MSSCLETIKDGKGKILAPPMTHNERKKWIKENVRKLLYLEWLYVEKRGHLYKLPLFPYIERWKEEENVF